MAFVYTPLVLLLLGIVSKNSILLIDFAIEEMETGTRKDSKTGEMVPAHYITEVKAEHNGKVVMQANWGDLNR